MNSTLRLDEVLGRMPYASNTTLLARDAAGGLWVYKPVRGEQPLWDFPWKTLAAREVLSFEISDAMGLDLVPETVMATGPFGPGSAQRFLEEDVEFDPRPLFTGVLDPVLWPFAVFDIVTNNADRKIGHMLREVGSDKLWAIDNGLTFHAEPKLRTVLWGFAGQPIPGELLEATHRLDAALDASLCDRVASLLSPAEAGALVSRTRTLLAARTHPEPPDDRPAVPWPVW
ncbi:MAG: phosphatidylinositol kinase [Acidimicrobiia bacterium]|nr:phosphatidylinositol kinase [Acidimicrobiia bacterium]MDH4306521.1 phosphatidylinositol kinase [Acidimicrobiia bacterium]